MTTQKEITLSEYAMEVEVMETCPPKPSQDQEKLLRAVYDGQVDVMETLLRNPEVKVDYVYPKLGTCLEVACATPSSRSDQVVKFLLRRVKRNVNEIRSEPIHYAAENGNHLALRELLRDYRTRVNAENSDGRTALHLAAKNFINNPENYSICLKLLVECPRLDMNRPNESNCTAIREAAESGSKEAVVKMLQLRPKDFDLDSHWHHKRTARKVIVKMFPDLKPILPPFKVAAPKVSLDQEKLLTAIKDSDVDLIETLLKNDEEKVKYFYPTCLEMACRSPSPRSDKVVQLLLEKVKPNIHGLKPEPIHYAAKNGNYLALRELLRHKRCRVNAESSDGRTALHLAAKNFVKNRENYSICLELLLECPTLDINRPNKKNCTAIREAAEFSGREAVVKMLELRPTGFDLDSHQYRGRTARQVIAKKFPDLEQILPPVKVATTETTDPQALLLAALLNRHLDVFKGLLQQVDYDGTPIMDPNYFYRQPYRTTCLNEACTDQNLYEYLRALLRANANANLVNVTTSKAPIHVSISRMNLPAVKLLLEQATLNVNIRDKHGDTPLHYVVRFVDDEQQAELLVREMLEKEANVDVKNEEGNTAVMAAALLKKKELVKAMLPETNIEEEITDGVTLKSFIQTHLPELREVINVDRQNTDMRTRLKKKLFLMLYAKDYETFVKNVIRTEMDDEQMKILLDEDNGKNTFLQAACSMLHTNTVVEVLLKKGVDPNHTIKENGSPPLVMAAEKKNYDVIKIMLNSVTRKVYVNNQDKKGNTALHVVAKNRNLDMVVLLLNEGARMDIKNNLGKEPISTEAMKDLMDMSLQADETMFPFDDEYRIKLNFGLFIQRQAAPAPASAETSMQTDVELFPLNRRGELINVRSATADLSESARLCYITETHREDCVLKHPLVTTFIYLKWPKMRMTYFAYLAYVTLFTVLLNVFLMMECNKNGECSNKVWVTFVSLITIFWSGIVIRELLQLSRDYRKYIFNIENYLDVALIVCTASSVFVKWDREDVRLNLSVLTVLLVMWQLFVVSGRMPILSEYIELFKTVTKNFFFFLIWYSTLLLSFALCFYLLMRVNSDSFSTFWLSLFNVFTMMSGDFNTENIKLSSVPLLCYLLFVAFIFLVAIVLLNLMISLAVSGVGGIRETASLLSVRSRVALIKNIEHSIIKIDKSFVSWLVRRIMIFPEGYDGDLVYIYPNSCSYVVGDSGWKLSMDQKVFSETMKIIGARSLAERQMTAKSVRQ